MLAKATLVGRSKLVLNSGLVREIAIWQIPHDRNYPEGVKYRLALVDPIWKKVLILFDNHHPKGHHWHDSNGKQHVYHFISMQLLVEDFLKIEIIQEKKYENNEN